MVQTRGRPAPEPPLPPLAPFIEGVLVLEGADPSGNWPRTVVEEVPSIQPGETTAHRMLQVHLLLEVDAEERLWVHLSDGMPLAAALRMVAQLGGQLQIHWPRPALVWRDDTGAVRMQLDDLVRVVDVVEGNWEEDDAVPPTRRVPAAVIRRTTHFVGVDLRGGWPAAELTTVFAPPDRDRRWQPSFLPQVLWEPRRDEGPHLTEVGTLYGGTCVYATSEWHDAWLVRRPDGRWFSVTREAPSRRFVDYVGPALDRLQWAFESEEQEGDDLARTARALGLPHPEACARAIENPVEDDWRVARALLERRVRSWLGGGQVQ